MGLACDFLAQSLGDSALDSGRLPPHPEHNRPLTAEELAQHEWQLDVPGFGEAGQRRLKNASVLVSRIGGLGSPVAFELAAAGVGRLVLAHAGCPQPSDLNRQLLMRADRLHVPRVEQAKQRLQEFKPGVEVIAVAENVSEENAKELIDQVDVVVDCAPMFAERFAMNDEAVRQGKPIIECAMYELQATLTTVIPGRTPCLRCLVPDAPIAWKRRFPVFGAVSGTVGCLAAMETVKVLSGLGECLTGELLQMDLRTMAFHRTAISRDPGCPVCGNTSRKPA